MKTHRELRGRCKTVLFVPRVFRVRRRIRNKSTKKSLERRRTRDESAELIGDGAGEAVDLFKAEDNVMLIGEIALL